MRTQKQATTTCTVDAKAVLEHAGTCYTLPSPSITFSLFHLELKTYPFKKCNPPP